MIIGERGSARRRLHRLPPELPLGMLSLLDDDDLLAVGWIGASNTFLLLPFLLLLPRSPLLPAFSVPLDIGFTAVAVAASGRWRRAGSGTNSS